MDPGQTNTWLTLSLTFFKAFNLFQKYNKPPGIEKAVRFTLQDGRVGPEICAEEGDTRRSLNIKRAVISLLQSPTKQATEVYFSLYTFTNKVH